MTLVAETLATLSIASGQTVSTTLGSVLTRGPLRVATSFLRDLTIILPQGLAEDVQVQISPVRSPGATDWALAGTVASTADEVASGGVIQLDSTAFKDLRIVAKAAVASTRNFVIVGKLSIPSD